jgi:hypothetical protein
MKVEVVFRWWGTVSIMWNLMRHSKNMENRKWGRVGGKESFTSLEIIKGTGRKTEIKKHLTWLSIVAVMYLIYRIFWGA